MGRNGAGQNSRADHSTLFKRINITYTNGYKGVSIKCWVKKQQAQEKYEDFPNGVYIFPIPYTFSSHCAFHWKDPFSLTSTSYLCLADVTLVTINLLELLEKAVQKYNLKYKMYNHWTQPSYT